MKFLIIWCCLTTLAAANPGARFSSGPVHSGTVEFELEVSGAKELRIETKLAGAEIDWKERSITDADGKRTPLEELKKIGGIYKLEGLQAEKLNAKFTIRRSDDRTSEVIVSHDSPRPLVSPELKTLKADPQRGRNVFLRGTCGSCHAIAGSGSSVGPDLAHIGKDVTVAALAESIIHPDAALANGFETNIITARDGTPHLGFVVKDSKDVVTIKDSGGQLHEIAKKDVVSRKPQSFSMMPGFGELLSVREIADLAAFLKAIQR